MFGTRIPQWIAFAAAALAVVGALYFGDVDARQRAPGYVKDLQAISALVREADQLGDKELAFVQMEAVTGLMQRMNQDPAPPKSKQRCMLAAQHLLDGSLDVHEGGSWASRERFDAAMQDCE